MWFQNPSALFANEAWMKFFPDPDAPTEEALDATFRFGLYASLFLWIFTQNPRYLLGIPLVALGTYLVWALTPDKEHFGSLKDTLNHIACRKPTPDNPTMNLMAHEFGKRDDPACDMNRPEVRNAANAYLNKGLVYDNGQQKHGFERQFTATPTTTTISDTVGFGKALYGATPNKHVY